ncbi:MAG: septal ring lytic transglycosylase RlpA family protein [Chloroflexi bacterium]|nr:septal ring lytic transglycosylase RlpA family protein [Chloroflexota bacterium]
MAKRLGIRLLLILVVCLVPVTPAAAFSFVVEEEDGSLTNLTRFRPPALLREHSEYTVVRLEYGNATYYHPSLHGNTMANGEPYSRFDPIIAASPFFSLGTVVRVTRLSTGAAIVVIVKDRAPSPGFMWIDLSEAAFIQLAPFVTGRFDVQLEVLSQ